MNALPSDYMTAIRERGLMHQCTDEAGLGELTSGKKPIAAYCGFDCTADSLHVGSLVPIMVMRLFQQHGHKPIILMGGGTTKVGDPSGKDSSRQLLTDEQIAENMAGIRKTFENFLTFGDGPTDALMVNNADWLDEISYIPFLRDYGRHFSVNRMLGFESVKLRLEREQNLSFLEFNYMILQAYDFLELSRRHDCVVQIGGSDQWGNIVAGVELGRRIDSRNLYGLTSPLLTTASGAKMGKTAQGAVWLNPERLSPYDYWQFWRNTEDADIGRFLRLFTELPIAEIEKLEKLKDSGINEAKKKLADEATRLCHGEKAAQEAAQTAKTTFEQGGAGDSLPSIEISRSDLEAGIPAFEIFHRAGLATSNGEARRLIKGGGGRVNDAIISNEMQPITLSDLNDEGFIKLSAGKKRHAIIEPG
ncbi:MAG: tyrosine--tRNA ligase [Rhodospirillaceae bacterium]|jgi:tyrosyl-tRNA synthetase|nr:tyrosine--tRNA ligase [Rhodospirillaceae bacterium]MBT5374249.1 tyrosine--tRNA ligase [Rhodospirillaceae bacterium]MBT5751669.1 tyrosine--tRNA ligase [Rhodospirillaceae bacterium]